MITNIPCMNRALRNLSTALGILVGFFGLEHGVFEILQGDLPTGGMQINAIGPAQRFWAYGAEGALTVLPTFLATGVLAVILGCLTVVWSVFFLKRAYGPWIFMGLSIGLLMGGGGIAPFTMALFIVITATRINKPLSWWRRLPTGLTGALGRLWPAALVALMAWSLIMVATGVFGYPLLLFFGAETVSLIVWALAYAFLPYLLFTIAVAFSSDVRGSPE